MKDGGEVREVLRLMWRDAENTFSACVRPKGKEDNDEKAVRLSDGGEGEVDPS